jgi:hypothetical protein
MVGEIKKWLGIATLERENLTLAKAVKKLQERCEQAETDAKATLEIALDCQAVYKDHENRLTTIEGQPKIEARARAKTVPFRQFKAAAESLPEED